MPGGEGVGQVKWPNDLMVYGRKAAGVLVESGPIDHQTVWMAVGIGVNLAHAPMNAERPATTLAAHMDFDAASRDRVARFWAAPNVAPAPGLKAVDLGAVPVEPEGAQIGAQVAVGDHVPAAAVVGQPIGIDSALR